MQDCASTATSINSHRVAQRNAKGRQSIVL